MAIKSSQTLVSEALKEVKTISTDDASSVDIVLTSLSASETRV